MPAEPWIGMAALTASALLYHALLAAVRRADRAYPSTDPTESTWWFGYARDVTNLTGAVAYTVSFVLCGYPGPLAILAGFVLTLLSYGADWILARALRVRRAGLVVGVTLLALALTAAALREPLRDGLGRLVRALF